MSDRTSQRQWGQGGGSPSGEQIEALGQSVERLEETRESLAQKRKLEGEVRVLLNGGEGGPPLSMRKVARLLRLESERPASPRRGANSRGRGRGQGRGPARGRGSPFPASDTVAPPRGRRDAIAAPKNLGLMLAKEKDLWRQVQTLSGRGDAPIPATQLPGLSRIAADDASQLRTLKSALLRKRDVVRDINRLRGREGDLQTTGGEDDIPRSAPAVAVSATESVTARSLDELTAHDKREGSGDDDNRAGTTDCEGTARGMASSEPRRNALSGVSMQGMAGGDQATGEGLENGKSAERSGSEVHFSGDDNDLNDEGEESEDEPTCAEVALAEEHLNRGMAAVEDGLILYDKTFEICCFLCSCNDQACDKCQIKEVLPSLSGGPTSSYYVRVHRRCCTTVRKHTMREHAITDYGIAVTTLPVNKKRAFEVDKKFLREKYEHAKRLRTEMLGDSTYKDPVCHRLTDERYNKLRRNFLAGRREITRRGRAKANVLSIFSGIGAGILALKRLNIAINKCVVVEHDPMAEAVCAGNHSEDVANYVWIKTFDDLEQRLDEIMEENAPFHILEGGAPCTEHSAVNANRAGLASEKGKYMLKLAQLIKKIQNHRLQRNERLFFLCENVATMELKDVMKLEPAFGISCVRIDAQYLSPLRRDRYYFTNIPLDELPTLNSPEALCNVKLVDGWMTPAQMHCHISNRQEPYSKANTLMASGGRVDDRRMIKVRLKDPADGNSIETSHYSVKDREDLMGFPRGYVEEVVQPIFERLCESFHSEDWTLNSFADKWGPSEIGVFSGRHYKFACDNEGDPKLSVKLGTVETSKRGKPLYYFGCEAYCKRLLGNSYSIPVVEHLLRPVKDFFFHREYANANYSFVWQSDGSC